MKRILGMGVVAALIAAILGGGGVHFPPSETAEAHGTCRNHQYRTYDGTHDGDGDGVGCESKLAPPWRRSSGSSSSGAGASTGSAASRASSSGYDRDNWDYDSRSARSRLGCASSEHVDHIVALKEAYDSGASVWSNARKSQFANDSLNQWCLLAGLNMSKSDGDLAEWRGGNCGQRKYIAQITVRVKQRYGLSIDTAERRAINTALAAGCSPAVVSSPTITPPRVAAAGARGVTGQIIARRLGDGRTEFGFQPTGGERVLPSSRFFPTDARVGRWLNSSPVRVDGVEIGRINARRLTDDRIEFAFTPTGEERVLPRSRYFPSSPSINRWLRSSVIDVSD